MVRVLLRLGCAFSLAVIAAALVFWWRNAGEAERKMAALQRDKWELEQVVGRLSAESRVADVIVTEQKTDAAGVATTLLFVEYDRAGAAMPPREFKVRGREVHVDAEVIEFERDLVMKGDPLRGRAVALFTRLYGDEQPPQSGPTIDPPGGVPAYYQAPNSPASAYEIKLWQRFWQFEQDPALRNDAGVKVAVGKGVWGPFEPGKLYTITLGADGNLSRKVEPIRGALGAYIGMLRKQ